MVLEVIIVTEMGREKDSKKLAIFYFFMWVFTWCVQFVKTLQAMHLGVMHFHVCIFYSKFYLQKIAFLFCTDCPK